MGNWGEEGCFGTLDDWLPAHVTELDPRANKTAADILAAKDIKSSLFVVPLLRLSGARAALFGIGVSES